MSGQKLGDRTPCKLTYHGFIMGLCQKARISLPPVVCETIEGVAGDRFIKRYYMPKQIGLSALLAPPTDTTPAQ